MPMNRFLDWLATTQGSIALHNSLYVYLLVSTVHVVPPRGGVGSRSAAAASSARRRRRRTRALGRDDRLGTDGCVRLFRLPPAAAAGDRQPGVGLCDRLSIAGRHVSVALVSMVRE